MFTVAVGNRLTAGHVNGMPLRVFLIRHGETEWSRLGRHTGRTDLPLAAHGEVEARDLARRLTGISFGQVFSSPRQRALQTSALAGLGSAPTIDHDLREWDYGDFEGLIKHEILARHPHWNVYRDGCPNGESATDVTARANRVVARLSALSGDIAVLSHGHFLRALAVRWIDLPLLHAQRLAISTASVGLLTSDHARADARIGLWNSTGSLLPA